MNKSRKQKHKHKKNPVKPVPGPWTKAGVIVTAIGVLVAIIAILIPYLKENKVERMIREINEKAVLIEATFHPNEIIVDSLTPPDHQQVKDYQTAVLESVLHWKSMNSMQPLKDFDFLETGELLNVELSQFEAIDNFDKKVGKALKSIDSLTKYGKSNNISYYVPKPNQIALLMIKAKNRLLVTQDVRNDVTQDILSLMIKYGNDPNGVPRRKVIRALKPCEKFYRSKESLDFINEFYFQTIELNSSYMHYLNHKNQ